MLKVLSKEQQELQSDLLADNYNIRMSETLNQQSSIQPIQQTLPQTNENSNHNLIESLVQITNSLDKVSNSNQNPQPLCIAIQTMQLPILNLQFKKNYYLKILYKPQKINLYQASSSPNKNARQNNLSPSLQQIDQKMLLKELRYFYNHFCKSTYVCGKNSSFQRIRQSINKMTVSTFVAFCRCFGVNMELTKLKEFYKKGSQYKTYMSFQELIQALFYIATATIVLPQVKDEEDNQFLITTCYKPLIEATCDPSRLLKEEDLHKIKKLLNITTIESILSKKKQLEASERKRGVNQHENQVKLIPKSNYKFKPTALNGRNPEQLKQQINLRRYIKNIKINDTKQTELQKLQFQERKFEYLNKISVSEKKILKGGYMSPCLVKNDKEQTQKSISVNLKTKNKKDSFKMLSIETQSRALPTDKIERTKPSIRHKTEMKTYTNSLDSSTVDIPQSRLSKIESNTSYMQAHRSKKMAHAYNQKNNTNIVLHYKVNKVIRQAKKQVNIYPSIQKVRQTESRLFKVNNPILSTEEELQKWLQMQQDEYLTKIRKQGEKKKTIL